MASIRGHFLFEAAVQCTLFKHAVYQVSNVKCSAKITSLSILVRIWSDV